MLGILANDTYRERLENRLQATDLFNAVIDDFKEFGPGESDADLYNRVQSLKSHLHVHNLFIRKKETEKVLVIAHHRVLKALFSSGVDKSIPIGREIGRGF